MKKLNLLFILLILSCTRSESPLIPYLLLYKNVNIERNAPSLNYGFTKTKYLTFLDNEISYIPNVTGTVPLTFSILPELPKGLTFNSSTGEIKGIVDESEVVKETEFTILVKNSWGENSVKVKLGILNPTAFTDLRNSKCYDTTADIACGNTTFPNQDFEFKGKTKAIAREFIASETVEEFPNDYFTFDKIRGNYFSCVNNQKGKDCSEGGKDPLNFDNAVKSCSDLNSLNLGKGYAGRRDWRLAEINELINTINLEEPVINETKFPQGGTVCSQYLSNTALFSDSSKIHYIVKDDAFIGNESKSISKCFYCIAGKTKSKNNFIDNNNFTVTDKRTSLVWQKCYLGQNLDSTCSGAPTERLWQQALQACRNLNLAGKSWRLPSLNELLSIFDFQKTTLPLHDSILGTYSNPNNTTQTSTTSSPAFNSRNYSIYFDDRIDTSIKFFDSQNIVRCVSDL
ncbi:MAG: DUF1566 domain-containing protein [Leptospiraceae bacterium]|nr:DUF1566 domain-containing protein [Leptospiraceae bacterium]